MSVPRSPMEWASGDRGATERFEETDRMKSPAVTRLCATLVAEIEAICATHAAERAAKLLSRLQPSPKRGRPRKGVR